MFHHFLSVFANVHSICKGPSHASDPPFLKKASISCILIFCRHVLLLSTYIYYKPLTRVIVTNITPRSVGHAAPTRAGAAADPGAPVRAAPGLAPGSRRGPAARPIPGRAAGSLGAARCPERPRNVAAFLGWLIQQFSLEPRIEVRAVFDVWAKTLAT